VSLKGVSAFPFPLHFLLNFHPCPCARGSVRTSSLEELMHMAPGSFDGETRTSMYDARYVVIEFALIVTHPCVNCWVY